MEWGFGKTLGAHVGYEGWGSGTKPGKRAVRQMGWQGERGAGRKTPGWGMEKGLSHQSWNRPAGWKRRYGWTGTGRGTG